MPTTALARTRNVAPTLPSADEVMALGKLLYDGGLQSKNCNSPAKLAVRIVAGMEVGLSPIQSINWIMVVNGRAVIWGDAALALVRASGKLESIEETIEGDGDYKTAVCRTARAVGKGKPAAVRETRFSVADARRANLWGKDGPWTEYPDRMLAMRARSWNLRDGFGDVLSGIGIAEEEMDVPKVEVRQVHKDTAPAAALDSKPGSVVAAVEAMNASEVVGETMLENIGDARPAWLRAIGVDPDDKDAVREAWTAKLAEYGVTSAKHLHPDKAMDLFRDIGNVAQAKEAEEAFGGAPSGN